MTPRSKIEFRDPNVPRKDIFLDELILPIINPTIIPRTSRNSFKTLSRVRNTILDQTIRDKVAQFRHMNTQ